MPSSNQPEVPACLTRDNLTSDYFPNLSRSGLYAVIALCLVFFYTSVHRLNHTDLWGHLSFGRWIAEHGELPQHDPFGIQGAETPVIPFAWLAQLAGHYTYQLAGRDGLIFGHALLETLAAGIVMLAVARRGVSGWWPAAAGVLFVILSLPILGTIRPQLFAQVGMALTLLALSELPRHKHPLYWLPFVFAVWVNCHASTLMGLATLGMVTIGLGYDLFEKSRRWQDALQNPIVQRHLLAVALAAVGTCFNPIGPGILWRVASFGNSSMLSTITEWQNLNPASLTGGLLIASALIAFFTIRQAPRLPSWGEIGLLVMFGLTTVMAIRMLVWWSLVWPWVVTPVLAQLFATASKSTEEDEDAQPLAMRTLIAIGLVFMTLLMAPPTHSFLHGRSRGMAVTNSADTPLHITDELQRRGVEGTFVGPLDWADYILWETHEKMQPLVYGHVHLSRPDGWKAYADISLGKDEWLTAARGQGVKYIVASWERNRELVRKLHDAELKLNARIVYRDRKCIMAEVLPPRKKKTPVKEEAKPAEKEAKEEANEAEKKDEAKEPAADNQSDNTAKSSE